VRAPAGHFHLDRGDAPVVLIAGGIGITPMLSMLNWSLAEQPGREIWLFYGVRQGRELVMKSHLEALASAHPISFVAVLQRSEGGRAGRGRFPTSGACRYQPVAHAIAAQALSLLHLRPHPMMESLVSALEDWGVPDARIHFEAFGPASIKRKQAAVASAAESPVAATETILVTFAQSGKQFVWQPTAGSLLEFAEANGITIHSGCRAGGCGSCQTTIRSGAVLYRQPPDYDPEPGTCLLCVSTPKTSVTLEA